MRILPHRRRQGRARGPNLTDVAPRLTVNDIKIRILNGGGNMPSFAGLLNREELDDLVSFLESRVQQPSRISGSNSVPAASAPEGIARGINDTARPFSK